MARLSESLKEDNFINIYASEKVAFLRRFFVCMTFFLCFGNNDFI